MKIGILTFHRATNYGAILQTYGLVSYLKAKGHDVQVIDYKPKGMGDLYASLNVPTFYRKLRRLVLNVYLIPSLPSRVKKRNMFWKYVESVLPLSGKVVSEKDLDLYDAFIVGSDQVWSTKFTGGLDKFYWGQFDRNGARLISYAGSAAEDMDDSFYNTQNAQLLTTFDSISVREEELRSYLQGALTNRVITKVLDPTILAGKEIFEQLIRSINKPTEPYVLIYQVIREKNEEIQDYARYLASKYECSVFEIKNSKLYITKNGKTKEEKGLLNPSVFVSLFKHASYIVTTSFHGTAFSLLFNRPFSVISIKPEVDSRSADLLDQLNLNERMITLPQNATYDEVFDWDRINLQMNQKRLPSIAFLSEALD